MNSATLTNPTGTPCNRCGGQLRLTYGDWNCLQCGRPPPAEPDTAACHECGGEVPDDRALCSPCANAIWQPHAREKATSRPKRQPHHRRRVKQARGKH